MEINAKRLEEISDCLVLDWKVAHDRRGRFSKTYQLNALSDKSLQAIKEAFHTTSVAGVFRGLHIYSGGPSYYKVISCLKGRVNDILVDVRPESPTFMKTYICELTESSSISLLIPSGIAHAFLALEDSIMLYMTSDEYKEECDRGININSIGKLPQELPCDIIISQRDKMLPTLSEYLNQQ